MAKLFPYPKFYRRTIVGSVFLLPFITPWIMVRWFERICPADLRTVNSYPHMCIDGISYSLSMLTGSFMLYVGMLATVAIVGFIGMNMYSRTVGSKSRNEQGSSK